MKRTNFLATAGLSVMLFLSACGGGAKSDTDIQKDVQSRINKPGVTAQVKDGTVTLTGSVATQEESKAAEASAKGEGVKTVVNNLQIKPR
jgi:osmotically-inducible protein OsmY